MSQEHRGPGDVDVARRSLEASGAVVGGVAVIMIALQLGVRGWALGGSWFSTDDFRLLDDAGRATGGPGGVWRYLNAPFDNQYMPVGRALAWVVASAGPVDWRVAAALTLLLQLLAAAACWWMLVTLFGRRAPVLVLLGIYLVLALTMPAFMWWAASLNQLPLQVVLFAAVGCWIRYLRGEGRRWHVFAALLVAFGLLAYVKALLVVVLLVWLGATLRRKGDPPSTGRRRPARPVTFSVLMWCAGGVVAAGAYLWWVPSPVRRPSWSVAGDLARSMLGRTLPTGLLGGPWVWDDANPPLGTADPPGWLVALTWAVIVVLVVQVASRRSGVGRPVAVLVGWVVADYLLLLTTRAPTFGAAAGDLARYLTDAVPVTVLCTGLATLPLVGLTGASEPRARPWSRLAAPTWSAGALGVVVVLGALLSTVRYVDLWHHHNPSDPWAHTVMTGLRDKGPVDLADTPVPADVVPGFAYPANTTARLVPLLVDNARFPQTSDDLVAIDPLGIPRHATIDAAATSAPGPADGCGYRVQGTGTDRSVSIPLAKPVFDFTWWVRIDYLSSSAGQVRVVAGAATITAPVQKGLASVFVEVTSAIDVVTLDGLSPGSTMCVSDVQVGQATAGGGLL